MYSLVKLAGAEGCSVEKSSHKRFHISRGKKALMYQGAVGPASDMSGNEEL